MKNFNPFFQWQLAWGSPRSLFQESEGHKLEIAFIVAILIHATPFAFLLHHQMTKKTPESVILQNVDLIEPEPEHPVAPPPPVEVQKPKSALEFLKMAIPLFNRPKPAPEIPREVELPKAAEPKVAEPDKLIEKKMAAPAIAPQIKLDLTKNAPIPKAADLSKMTQMQKAEVRMADPSLKLEEVGRKAVAVPAAPAIALSMSRKPDKVLELASLPKTQIAAQTPQATERLVEKSYTPTKAPSLSGSAPLGYQRRGEAAVSLDQAREPVRMMPKPELSKPLATSKAKSGPETLSISKDRVKITGPLSSRKVIASSIPEYPAWAKARNIEADVAIRFTVAAAGDVVSSVIERTSGYPELDKSSMKELKKWKFSPLGAGGQDQWGVITFRFLLQ